MSADNVFMTIAIGTIAFSIFTALFMTDWLQKSSERTFIIKVVTMATLGTVGVLGIVIGAVTGTIDGNIEVVLVLLGFSVTTLLLVVMMTAWLSGRAEVEQ